MKQAAFIMFFMLFAFVANSQNALAQAETLRQREDFSASSEILLDFIHQNQHRKFDVARAWLLHSENLLAQGEFEQALAANDSSLYQRNLLRSVEIAENYGLKGRILLANKDPYAALNVLNSGLNFMIEDPLLYASFYSLSAQAYSDVGQLNDAISSLEVAYEIMAIEVGEQNKQIGYLHFLWGQILLKNEQVEEAYPHFQKAFWLQEDLSQRLQALGLCRKCFDILHPDKE